MNGLTDREAGELAAEVNHLTAAVTKLDARVQHLENQIAGGRGFVVGVLALAGAVGAGMATLVEKLTG